MELQSPKSLQLYHLLIHLCLLIFHHLPKTNPFHKELPINLHPHFIDHFQQLVLIIQPIYLNNLNNLFGDILSHLEYFVKLTMFQYYKQLAVESLSLLMLLLVVIKVFVQQVGHN